MCLSTAYKNEIKEENIIMKNVMGIKVADGLVILTDLMERKMEVPGILKEANLMDNFIVIGENKDGKKA